MLMACKKEVTMPNNGIYRGTFYEFGQTGDTLAQGVVYIAMFESNQTFSMVGDSVNLAPASHSGTYIIDNSNYMSFTNTSAPTTLYDNDHYLDTTFQYAFDDVNFSLDLTKAGKTYQYRLVRN